MYTSKEDYDYLTTVDMQCTKSLTLSFNLVISFSAAFSLPLGGCADPPTGRVTALVEGLALALPVDFTGAFAFAAAGDAFVEIFEGTFFTAAGLGAPNLVGARKKNLIGTKQSTLQEPLLHIVPHC